MTLSRKELFKRIIIITIAMSLCIPIVIMAYESILLGKESVVFLADYPTYVGTVIIIY